MSNNDKYDISQKQSNMAFWNCNDGYEIPYNQRCYEWSEKELREYMDDIYNYFDNKLSFFTFGTFYFLKETKNVSTSRVTIWDGQQRIITSYIILASLLKILRDLLDQLNKDISKKNKKNESTKKIDYKVRKCEDLIDKIENYLFKKKYQLNDNEKKQFLDNNMKIPKIYSVHPTDNKILKKIFNLEIESVKICYEKIKDKYKCKNCDKEYRFESHMADHLYRCEGKKYDGFDKIMNDYKNDDNIKNHKMIFAFHYITKSLYDKFTDKINKIDDFLKVFEEKIPHDEYICKDVECASIIFDLLNNRGKQLGSNDIMRNYLMRLLPENKREKYFSKFQEITQLPEIEKKYGIKEEDFLKLICFMANKKLEDNVDTAEIYKNFLDSDEGNVELNFKQIEEQTIIFFKMREYISEKCKWGQIYFLEPIIDIYKCFIMPFYQIFYKEKNFDKIFDNYMEIIVCYELKSYEKQKNFTNIKKEMHEFGNKIYDNKFKLNNICDELKEFIQKYMLKNIDDDSINNLLTKNISPKNAKRILLYYENKIRPDGIKFDMDAIDIEHIMPKASGNKYINRIGNLALLEKGKSANGHLGNRSLQDKDFTKKIKEYKQSNFQSTKDIEDTKKWTLDNINKRSKIIINKISEYINNYFTCDENKSSCSEESNNHSEDSDDSESSDEQSDTSSEKSYNSSKISKKKSSESSDDAPGVTKKKQIKKSSESSDDAPRATNKKQIKKSSEDAPKIKKKNNNNKN